MFSLRACRAVAVAVLLAPLSVAVTPPAAAAPDLCAQDAVPAGLTRFKWTGNGATDAWDLAANWAVTGPDGLAPGAHFNDGKPNYFGHADSDNSTTAYVCIPSQASPLTITLNDEVNVHVLSIDVGANVTLESGTGARVWVYGDPADFETRFRDRSTVRVISSTLGGPGLIRVEGDLEWRSTDSGAATFDTDFCAELQSFPGDQRTAGCATIRPGVLRVAAGGDLVVPGRGVNLLDDYRIEVRAGGAVSLQGQGYIAADRETWVTVFPEGVFDFANDGSVFEGFTNAAGDELAKFVNNGTLRKSAGDGRSAIVARYSGTGAIEVEHGSIDILNGTSTPATVAPGSSVGTGRCVEAAACDVEVTPEDPQNALLTLPPAASDPDGASVAVAEDMAIGDLTEEIQPAVNVTVDGLAPGTEAELDLEYHRTLRRLPRDPAKVRMFQRKADDDVDRELPRCNDDANHSIPNGVTACVLRVHVSPDRVRITVKSTAPGGRWTARRRGADRKTVASPRRTVTGEGSPFAYDNDEDAVTPLSLVPVDCGPATTTSWERSLQWRKQSLDSRAVGWIPNGTGRALTLNGQVGNLAWLEGFDLGIRVENGNLSGMARVVRHVSPTTRWVGLTALDLTDAPIAGVPGQPDWRIVDGSPLRYTWTKYVGGVPDGAPVDATIAELLALAGERSVSTPDTVGIGFGCNGEDVVLDDFRVYRNGDRRDDQWNLEAPKPSIRFARLTSRSCRVSSDRARGTVAVDQDGAWSLWWSNDQGATMRRLVPPDVRPAGRTAIEFELPREPQGRIELVFPSPGLDLRTASSGSYGMPSTPPIDLTRITKKVQFGKKVVVKGEVGLDGQHLVRLYVVRKGTRTLDRTKITTMTNADGEFTLRYTAPRRRTKLAFAAEVAAGDGWAKAISPRVLITRIVRPPTRRVATVPDDGDQIPIYDPPEDEDPIYDPIERGPAREIVCTFTLNRRLR